MTTWFVSDTHFGHKNIITYSNRPFTSVEEMNEILIQNWNKCVKPSDNIWHLGDFGFGRAAQLLNILHRLNGYKMLILGNHDQEITKNFSEFSRPTDFMGFTTIQNYAEIKYNNTKICLFHYGQRVWNKSHHGAIQLYGHSHGSLPPFGKSVDVGVDAPFILNRWPDSQPMAPLPLDLVRRQEDYRPVSIDEVMEYMNNRPIEYVDHHGGNR